MRLKFIFRILLGFTLILYSAFYVNAQTSNPGDDLNEIIKKQVSIPGVNCGVAEGRDGTNICCSKKDQGSVKDEVDKRVPDLCLINIKVPIPFASDPELKGFCIGELAKNILNKVADIPAVKGILSLERKNPVNPCITGEAQGSGNSCTCKQTKASSQRLCDDYLKGSKEYGACSDCAGKGVWTGLGCIRTTPEGFIRSNVLGWGMGFAGGVALLCIFYAAFIMQTSRGNPERLKKAREYLNNCLIGLAIIIFSVFILQVIGLNILQIPGFG